MTERIFVTGEDGQLARLLTREFRERGHRVVNDDVMAERTWRTREQRAPELNFTDERVLLAVAVTDPTLVVHAGALVNTDRCEAAPALATRINILGTEQVARAFPRARLVYFSTTAIYDKDAPRPLTERSRVVPYTAYGQTKWAGELVARELAGDRLLVVRPCFVYGGERDTSSVLARLIRRTLAASFDPLYVTLGLRYLKDFLHASDFATVTARLILGKETGTFNVFAGAPRPYRDAVEILAQNGLIVRATFDATRDYLGDHVVGTEHEREPHDYLDLKHGVPLAIEEIRRGSTG